MAHVRKCIVDKTQYEYCPVCEGKYDASQKWRVLFCSENCKEIYDVCEEFASGSVDALESKSKLDKLDLSNIKDFAMPLQNNIADINKAKVEVKAEKKTKKSIVIE